MYYTASLTVISEQEFLTLYDGFRLERETREYTDMQPFSYAAAQDSESATTGLVNKRDWEKRRLCNTVQSHRIHKAIHGFPGSQGSPAIPRSIILSTQARELHPVIFGAGL